MLDDEARGQWGSRAEFVLLLSGASAGIANVWRFPYQAYECGGGGWRTLYAFIIDCE